ncbi:MAG: minor capsid protein [Clostridium sp.]
MDKVKFIEGLYSMSTVELNKVYRLLKKSKDKVLQELADIILKYTVDNNIMHISASERKMLMNELTKEVDELLKDKCTSEITITEKLLETVIIESLKFYEWNYNIKFKDVRKIIDNAFKGKHFSNRIWDEEGKVAQKLHKQIKDFLDGKINVNQIKKQIESTFNSSAYNAKRLVETEVGRVHDEAFKRFCKETGVEKVKRNAVLDAKTCSDCGEYDGEIYDLDKAPVLPIHPLCRCFYDIVE